MKENIGIILAGGIGERLQRDIAKQYVEIAGREVIAYVVDAYREAQLLDDIVVVVNEAQYKSGHIRDQYGLACCLGGKTRNGSIANGIAYVKEHYPDCKKIIFHDAARPFIRGDIIDDFMRLLDDYQAVHVKLDITDGIGKYENVEAKREKYYLTQTPEAFRFPEFYQAFKEEDPIVALVHQLPEDAAVYHYDGFPYNIKITFEEDLFVAEQLLQAGFKEFMAEQRHKREAKNI